MMLKMRYDIQNKLWRDKRWNGSKPLGGNFYRKRE